MFKERDKRRSAEIYFFPLRKKEIAQLFRSDRYGWRAYCEKPRYFSGGSFDLIMRNFSIRPFSHFVHFVCRLCGNLVHCSTFRPPGRVDRCGSEEASCLRRIPTLFTSNVIRECLCQRMRRTCGASVVAILRFQMRQSLNCRKMSSLSRRLYTRHFRNMC